VTGVTLATSPRHLVPTARHPSMVLVRRMSRVAGRSGALWGVVFGVFIVVQTRGYTSTYKTEASRHQLARAYGTNAGLNALLGLPHAMNTVAGWSEWRFIGILGPIGCIWGLLISTRLMRGEEEAGRYELLLAGQTTRLRAGCQALAGLGVGCLALFTLTALGTIVTSSAPSVGFGLSRSLAFSLALVAGAAMFLAIGALASQLVTSRRAAASVAGAIFGASFALRMVGDSSSGPHWLVWLSPLGWVEQFHPLTDPVPLAMLPVLGLILLTTAMTLRLARTRDVGAATLPERSATKAHLALLGGSTGLALRLMRPVAVGWLFAVAAFSVLIGTTAASSTKDVVGTNGIEKAVERLGGHGSPVADYLGLTFMVLALLVALISAG
jgi:ABC-2 type transport system permease protein